jgi:hypothetical protein
MVRATFDSPLFDLEGFFLFTIDFVEVFFLGLGGGTTVIGSIFGMEELISYGSVTSFSSVVWGLVLVDMLMWLFW